MTGRFFACQYSTNRALARNVMNKAFIKETEDSDDDEFPVAAFPTGAKNYITPKGYVSLRNELLDFIDNERPKVVEAVHWAASNGGSLGEW